jgi:ABC-type sugar transport system ATPase subunit
VPQSAVGASVTLGVRPEDLEVTTGPGLFTGPIRIVEKLGEVTLLYIETDHHEPIVVKVDGDADFARGQTVTVTAPADRLHVFDGDGKAFKRVAVAQAA